MEIWGGVPLTLTRGLTALVTAVGLVYPSMLQKWLFLIKAIDLANTNLLLQISIETL